MENMIRFKHDYTSSVKIDEEIEPWILYIGFQELDKLSIPKQLASTST